MLRIFIIAALLMTFAPISFGQDKSAYPSASRTANIHEWLDQARQNLDDPAVAFNYIEQALMASLRQNDKTGEGLSYQLLGIVNGNMNQHDLAVEYLKKALGIFDGAGERRLAHETRRNLAEAYQELGNYDESVDQYRSYIAVEKDAEKLIAAKYKLAEAYDSLSRNEETLQTLKEILEMEMQRNDREGVIAAQNKLAAFYSGANNDDQALATYQQAAEMAREIENKKMLSNTLKQQGAVLRRRRQYDEELKVRRELLDLAETDAPAQAEEHREIGAIYLERDESEKAIPHIRRSLELSESAGALEEKSKALKTLSDAYNEQRAYDKALEAYKEYVETMDDIHRKKEEEIKSSLQLTASLNRKLERMDLIEKELQLSEKTVELLRQETQLNRKELKAQRIFTYSLTSALFIFLGASAFVYRSGAQKRKANQMLALRSLRSQMNPHFIYNSLNSVNNHISRNDEKTANKYLSDFSKLMRAVMENSKHDFVPLSSEIAIIRLYLSLEHARFCDKFEYALEVDDEIDADAHEIPPMLIQPFVENAIWHGLRYREDKGHLRVKFTKTSGGIAAIVEDDGIGRQKSQEIKTRHQKEHQSTGLLNIQNRTQLINSLFDINISVNIEDLNAADKTGTRATIVIPPKK